MKKTAKLIKILAALGAGLALLAAAGLLIGVPYMKKELAPAPVEVSPEPSPGIGELEKIEDSCCTRTGATALSPRL